MHQKKGGKINKENLEKNKTCKKEREIEFKLKLPCQWEQAKS